LETVFTARLLPDAKTAPEEDWLAAARTGEAWALERFYACYHAPVYALCRRLLGGCEDAQDAMQTAFVRAFRELPRFRGESSAKTWLYRIAVNECLSQLRRRREMGEVFEETGAPDGSVAVVERIAVIAALRRTKPDHRAILVLRYWEGLSYEEIACVLRISLPATKMRLRRARDEFRRCYEEE
jgi:RNA polymerase sigma-70 factor (ECF subfamily)